MPEAGVGPLRQTARGSTCCRAAHLPSFHSHQTKPVTQCAETASRPPAGAVQRIGGQICFAAAHSLHAGPRPVGSIWKVIVCDPIMSACKSSEFSNHLGAPPPHKTRASMYAICTRTNTDMLTYIRMHMPCIEQCIQYVPCLTT